MNPDPLPPITVPYVDFPSQFRHERDELMPVVEGVLASGDYVGGKVIDQLEEEVAAYVGVKHCVAVNSGTDALVIGLRCLGVGPGDEVITPPNSFLASTGCVANVGATPVFVDVKDDQNLNPPLLDSVITTKTKAIMPVHLTGRVCDMDPIMAIARMRGIAVIEDAAQSMGSTYRGKKSGSFGEVGCFSCHPLKNLNACGDGGFITTDDGEIATRARRLRNHGLIDRNISGEWGYVSRMDCLQAAILRVRLRHLPEVIEKRLKNANLYRKLLDPKHVFVPACQPYEGNTFCSFVLQVDRRDALIAHLRANGIGSSIHYPIPIHLMPAARPLGHKKGDFPVVEKQADRIITLPVHQFLSSEQIAKVSDCINSFYSR